MRPCWPGGRGDGGTGDRGAGSVRRRGPRATRAQPSLFPDTSPCYGTRSTHVTRHCLPGSYCPHADGELRTVNGPSAELAFWTAANTTLTVAIAAALHGVANEIDGTRHVKGTLGLGHPCDRADG
ncbi:hypothetical protein GCM10010433_25510 [Streptomyces pulveraceus]